jgi:clathrin heavy chain
MDNCQIMNYEVDATEKWCFVVGLYMDANRQLLSRIQLFNIDQGKTMPLEGYAACFGEMPVVDGLNGGKNQLFAFCMRKANDPSQKLQITELSQDPSKAFKVNTEIKLAQDAPNDIPIMMQACNKYGMIFIITKEGYFYMYEASTAALVYR